MTFAKAVSIGLLILSGCGQRESESEFQDIYRNDALTRRTATSLEAAWTVSLGGCTGSMLSETRLLTANHCQPRAGANYTSGAALAAGKRLDLKAVRVLEASSKYDYSIVEVSWTNDSYKLVQRYTPFIQTKDSDIKTGLDSNAETSRLITIGFPTDKRTVQYATGFAKRQKLTTLLYNIGTINGNSGGAVWKVPEMMLVSQTNFGPHSYGQPGWNNNDPENSNAWNGGGRMDSIYSQSSVLKDMFPEGKSRFADENGELLSH